MGMHLCSPGSRLLPNHTAAALPTTNNAPRHFGRFELRQMLGRSHASSIWVALDPRLQQDVLLCVPRAQPRGLTEMDAWMQDAQLGSRLKHPRLSEVLEVSAQDGWPFVSYVRAQSVSLFERLSSGPSLPPLDSVVILCDVLEGVAYAHEAGVAHQDIALHNVLIDQSGHATVAGLSAGLAPLAPGQQSPRHHGRQQIREAAERDVLMVGLLAYRILANSPALDEPDLGSAATRIGTEIVRLPWTTPHPVPETLRAIVNRATDRQQRQRYLNARTLLSALQGWIKTNSQDAGGPLALLLDRLNAVGALPGRPHTERALIGTLSQESLRVDDFVDIIVKNPALCWEMLRAVNVATYQSQSADDGVTTLSRAVILLGQQGLRKVASGVRPWPGALGAIGALGAQTSQSGEAGSQPVLELGKELHQTCLAGHIARLLAPFSISDEEASVTAMSQRLGWLLVLYHFPEEAAQIKRLMLPGPPANADSTTPTLGMTIEAATGAVLGVNLDDLTAAVLKHWGLHERLIQAARPLGRSAPVRTPSSPEDSLRAVASLANEMVNAAALGPQKAGQALNQVYARYARALALSAKECNLTLEHAMRLVDANGAAPGATGLSPA
jgi:HD-like signal output (HDOD) protein